MEKHISTAKARVTKEMQTWVDMAKEAKAQVQHAQKEIKANAPWIDVVKKQKGTSMNRMNAALEEEAKRKARMVHVQVVGWAEKGSPQEDAIISEQRLGHQIFNLLQHGGWEELKPFFIYASWISIRKKLSYVKEGNSRVRKYTYITISL